jgi:hypothetical protein
MVGLLQQNSKMTALKLTLINDEYFPIDDTDLLSLRDKKVLMTRIPRQSLQLLKQTLLKGVTVKVLPWREVYASLRERFSSSLTKEKFKFKVESNDRLVIKFAPTSSDRLDKLLSAYRTYLLRYGYAVRKTYKDCDDHTLVRLLLEPDSSISPLHGFASVNKSSHSDAEPTVAYLHLSPVARLSITLTEKTSSLPPLVTIAFQDKSGETWVEILRRSFDVKTLDKKNILNFASYLVALHE